MKDMGKVNELSDEDVRVKAQKDPSSLSEDELRFAVERDYLSERQLIELGLDEPRKVQALLRGDQGYDPQNFPHSGNFMSLTEDEMAIIEARRQKALEEPTPEINVSSAIETEEVEAPYSEWTNTELRQEIAARNDDRDESSKLSIDGRKDDLVATLEADDAANAG